MYEAKKEIIVIFGAVEKQINLTQDEKKLKKLSDLKEKVIEAMLKYDTLQKWSSYKTTDEFKAIVKEFADDAWKEHPQISLACEYFKKPCFFNED